MITPAYAPTATERVFPRMALDFTTGVLDSRVTISRALNTATRVNSSGFIEVVNSNLPRFDYDPVTLAPKGLLIEESRSNALLYSAQFDVSSWQKNNLTVSANAIVSPDGTQSADKIVEAATTSAHYVISNGPNFSAVSGTAYTFSCYFKKGERSWAVIEMNGAPLNCYAYFDLTNGVVGTIVGTPSATSITPVGDDWYRCTITKTATSSAIIYFAAYTTSGNNVISYAGNGTSGIYIWGAQVEAGAFATSYIPTTTTALTRNADVATITGSNFTSFWNATQGGATVQALPSTVSGIRPLVQYDDGTANEIIALRGNTTNPELYIVDGGTPQAQLDAGTIAANTAYSLTGWWATNDCRARKDSGAAVTDATATIPTVTQARIGSDGTNYLNGTIASINYYAAFSSQIYTRRKNKVVSSLF